MKQKDRDVITMAARLVAEHISESMKDLIRQLNDYKSLDRQVSSLAHINESLSDKNTQQMRDYAELNDRYNKMAKTLGEQLKVKSNSEIEVNSLRELLAKKDAAVEALQKKIFELEPDDYDR